MSSLRVSSPVTPESAGWEYVGFELLPLGGDRVARETGDRELCLVVVSGRCRVISANGDWDLGGRPDPFSGPPAAAYLPPGTGFELDGEGEVALCTAPAPGGGAAPRPLPGAAISVERRGHGTHERAVTPILMEEGAAESLLVCEVDTPPGHWSSYPPHKHDRDALPQESFLEETYYHRIMPEGGFAMQRVYTEDGTIDESIPVRDGDIVLVPRGYHTVAAPPGYRVWYLNVMAGPRRKWAVVNDPDHDWISRQP
ncbi:MAG: 5-deoxy-glucuronate isomerase [Actinobacteria bacterium]|nr:5-deoxy-glucuronate isomerase [Actinomycetota bacterium]